MPSIASLDGLRLDALLASRGDDEEADLATGLQGRGKRASSAPRNIPPVFQAPSLLDAEGLHHSRIAPLGVVGYGAEREREGPAVARGDAALVSAKGRTLSTPGSAAMREIEPRPGPAAELRKLRFLVDADMEARNFENRIDKSELEAVHDAEDDDEGGHADRDARGREKGGGRAAALPPPREPAAGHEADPRRPRINSPSSGPGRRRRRIRL